MQNSSKIRNQFIEFFKERNHTFVPSAPVFIADDPTLLFTNAGMNQFKDVFLGLGTRSYKRAVNSQKIIRVAGKHNDLEEVGPSPYHHTFFEMLGNWSFGDYYKEESINWAWDLITKVWGIDSKRLYPTIFEGNDEAPRDDEAFNTWKAVSGLPDEQITPHPAKDNFWEMGNIGPCGPCSELHYDMGADFCRQKDVSGHECKVNGTCGRIVELWNLVFIQYRRDKQGKLHPLPEKHVDTGAGFERIALVLENAKSNYETSIFQPLIKSIEDISGIPYSSGKEGNPHRVACDHIRTLAFSLADGILPSNEGRGYVIRRILRRAAKFGREISLETPFLYKMVDPLIDSMGDAYPELKERYQHITGVIKAEEESFARTLGKGLELFSLVVDKVRKKSGDSIPGKEAFTLFDTFGFPLDLTQLMARENDLNVDTEEFEKLMDEQRSRSRKTENFETSTELKSGLKSDFIGYEFTEYESLIESISKGKKQIEIVLNATPFYAESGGQEADLGKIESSEGYLTVLSVNKKGEVIVHCGRWEGDSLPEVGTKVTAKINTDRRLQIEYNHTATHLLHRALRNLIGEHASQAGSLVAADHLRFDFTHFKALTQDQKNEIEMEVNIQIRRNLNITTSELPYKKAIEEGITALFGEKYSDIVRVVQIGSEKAFYSRELCGGTHVNNTGQLGLFRIIYEGSVSTGVRRIEAITGQAALDLTFKERDKLTEIRELLGSHGSDEVKKLEKLLDEKKDLEKELNTMLGAWAENSADRIINDSLDISGIKCATKLFDETSIDRMKLVGDSIRRKGGRIAALLASPAKNGAGQLCCVVSDALITEGKIKAGILVGQAAKLAGGGGGGRPHMATAGTKFPEKLNHAIIEFPKLLRDLAN